IESYLSGAHMTGVRAEKEMYDRGDLEDLSRIVEVMMFHEAAGAANYTGLSNRQGQFADFNDLLQFDQAILIGRGANAAELQIDGQPASAAEMGRHETVYRFLLPVTIR